MADIEERELLQHGDFVHVRQTRWLGQIVNMRMMGFNEPEFEVRIWTGTVLFKEWFSECELEPAPDADDGGGGGENVVRVDFTKRVKLEDVEPEGAA